MKQFIYKDNRHKCLFTSFITFVIPNNVRVIFLDVVYAIILRIILFYFCNNNMCMLLWYYIKVYLLFYILYDII